jgi:hypothetical protein
MRPLMFIVVLLWVHLCEAAECPPPGQGQQRLFPQLSTFEQRGLAGIEITFTEGPTQPRDLT